MLSFLARHAAVVKGAISGFDRVRFRGTLRWLANVKGLETWLRHSQVLLKDFREYALEVTETIKHATQQIAETQGRPREYLASSAVRKEDQARQIARQDGITEGLVCVLTAVEPCITFTAGPNRQQKKLEIRRHEGKCLHHYFYLIDPQWGWLNVRLQTWFPFTVQVVINGREWLARQLLQAGVAFERRDNCFVDIADMVRAQQLMDQQLETCWSARLDQLLRQVHPSHQQLFGADPLHYYWSADETEWATDVLFRSPDDLAQLYPRLVHHGMTSFGSQEVLRFLGKRPCVQQFRTAELLSHLGRRCEGVRVKHTLGRNSVKMYDKQGSVLRVETTLNDTRQMKVYRARENDPHGPKSYQKLRKGVADLHRRAEISQRSNERYLAAQAVVENEESLHQCVSPVCQRTQWRGRSARALNPFSESDARLLETINRGEFALQGFRNRDLCAALFGEPDGLSEKQRMSRVTRLIRLLRAHGLVHKVSGTHRYQISPQGRLTITTLLTARNANLKQLTDLAL